MIRTEFVVPIAALDGGFRFPRVCVKTGASAETTIKKQVLWAPPWTYVFLLLGVLPFVLVYYLAGKKRTIEVPATGPVAARRRNLVIAAWGCVLLAIVTPFITIGSGLEWLMLVPIMGIFVFGIAAARAWIVISMHEHELRLRRVHPNFVGAAQQLLGTFPGPPPPPYAPYPASTPYPPAHSDPPMPPPPRPRAPKVPPPPPPRRT